MIFKTFNSDIDKMSAKWGILGRSFNDIGAAMNAKIAAINKNFPATDDLIGSIQNSSDSIWKRLYPSKESIESQLIDVDTLYPDINDATASKLLTNLQKEQISVNANKKTWQDYFNGPGEGEKWQIEFVQNTDLQKASLDDVKKAYNSTREAAIAHNAALQQQTLSAKAATATAKALAVAGNMIAMFAISKAISWTYKAIDNYIHRLENAREQLAETNSELESVESEIKDINLRIDELLAKGTLTLTDENDLKRLREENEESKIRQAILQAQKAEDVKDLNKKIEDKYDKTYNNGTEITFIDENGNHIGLSGEEYLKNRMAYAKQLIGLNRELTDQEKEDLQAIRDYALEQGKSIIDLTDGYEAVTEEEKAQKAVWDGLLADIAYIADNEAGTIPDITRRLEEKFANGVLGDITDLWAREYRKNCRMDRITARS